MENIQKYPEKIVYIVMFYIGVFGIYFLDSPQLFVMFRNTIRDPPLQGGEYKNILDKYSLYKYNSYIPDLTNRDMFDIFHEWGKIFDRS